VHPPVRIRGAGTRSIVGNTPSESDWDALIGWPHPGAPLRRAKRPKDRLIVDLIHGGAGPENEVVAGGRLLGMVRS
jgi:hypothetical protein